MTRRTSLDRLPLGSIMAGAFAAAVAFAIFAMPNWRLSGLVVASGLPGLLSAAEPPLGTTARALVMIVAAAIGGAAVWSLFAWIERPHARHRFAGRAKPARAVRSATSADKPTLRRADAHPDAPARRPIFAAEDLGAPLDDAPVAAWREDSRRLTAVAASADDAELLLDVPIDADADVVATAAAAQYPADSAAGLIARLEAGLAKAGRMPRPDARLRDALGRAANG